MPRITRTIFLALVALATLSVARLRADEFDALRERIPQDLTRRGVPSVAVAVARDGRIVWEQAFGWADRENRVPATEHTMYSLASISKPIAATGLAILAQRGKIDLDRPINEYLGDAKLVARVGNGNDATVRRVANHTSGLPLHYQFFYVDQPYRRPPMDETIRRYGNLVTAPGERFQYSNLGYGVIDYVIARTSNRSFVDFMREEVFLPLGLTHMSIDIGPGLEKHQAIRYGQDGLPIPFYDFDHPGGSAVYSSAHDLVRFGMFHAGDKLPEQREILSDEWRTKMQEPTADRGGDGHYGLGWFIGAGPQGTRQISHSGGMGGVSTLLTILPDRHVVVVVLTNSSSQYPGRLSREILELALKNAAPSQADDAPQASKDVAAKPADGGNPAASFFRSALAKKSSEKAPAEKEAPPTFDSLVGLWKGHVHTYVRDIPVTVRVKPDGDVHVQLAGQLITLLNGSRFDRGWLTGNLTADVGTEDANRMPYDLRLEVKLRDGVLGGSLIALSRPAPRVGNALTHWIELRKDEEK